MARKTLLYFLLGKNGKPLYVDNNGLVQEGDENLLKPDGQPACLRKSPFGWRDTLIKYGRSVKYMGMMRDYTGGMKFAEDGMTIINDQLWKYGYEAELTLVVHRLDRSSNGYLYKVYYVTELNLPKLKKNLTTIDVPALEGGPSKYLKSNEGKQYELPIDSDPNHIQLYHDGIEFNNRAISFVGNGDSEVGSDYFGNHIVEALIVQEEVDNIGSVQSVERTKVGNVNNDIRATGKWHFKASTAGNVLVEVNFDLGIEYVGPPGINPAAEVKVVARVIHSNGIADTQLEFLVLDSASVNGNHVVAGSGTLSVVDGDEIYLYTFCNVQGASGDANMRFTYGGAEPTLKIDYVFRHVPTFIKGLYEYRVGQLLVEQLTEGRYQFKSDWLAKKKDIMLTSGDAIHGLRDAVIKTSMNDFFQYLKARGEEDGTSVGLGIEGGYIVIEPLSYFFDSTKTTVTLGEVANVSYEIAEDLCFNYIKAGYAAQEYEEINGRTEFNQGQEWDTPVKKIVRDLDLVSPYRSDAVGIERYRTNFDKKTTTDSDNDNHTFAINITEESIADPGKFHAATIANNSYSGTSLVAYEQQNLGPSFVSNVAKTEFTYTGAIQQNIWFDVYMLATGGGGVDPVVISVLLNGAVFATAALPIGATNGISVSIPIAYNDVLAVQVSGMGGPLVVEQSGIGFGYQVAGIYELNRPAFTSLTGIEFPDSIFNVLLSPKKGLLRNGAVLRSAMLKLEAERFLLNRADKNKELAYVLNGATHIEKDPIQIGSLASPLYLPVYINFTTKVPLNLLTLVDASPYGKVLFTVKGVEYVGFLWDGGIKPPDNEKQVWKVLSLPTNDLRNFNNV